jgi:hypothetical protein
MKAWFLAVLRDALDMGGRRNKDGAMPLGRVSINSEVEGLKAITSLAPIRLRGSNMRNLLSRSSASELAAVKSCFRGDFGKSPTKT